MNAFFEHASRMPVLDARSADEIIGYDDLGLPFDGPGYIGN